MIQDLNLRMDYQLTLTTSGQSTNYIDTLAEADAMPAGSLAMWRVLCVTTPVASFGTITITLQTCANNLFDSNAMTLASSAALNLLKIQAQTANIAPPSYVPWPYQPATTILGPVLIWMAIPPGCQQFLRTGYAISANAGFSSIGLSSIMVLDADKLLDDNFPLQGSDIR